MIYIDLTALTQSTMETINYHCKMKNGGIYSAVIVSLADLQCDLPE